MRIGIFHYSLPPTPGGVERIVAAHARLLQRHGHEVFLFHGGRHPVEMPGFPCVSLPKDTGSRHASREAAILAMVSEARVDCWMVHNLFTMPFDLEATCAFWQVAGAGTVSVISWIHDIAACNAHYEISTTGPSAMLRQHPPGTTVVTVSAARQQEYRSLTGHDAAEVIPNGMDAFPGSGLPKEIAECLTGSDPVLVYPTRILRRKNIPLGLRTVRAMVDAGRRPLYLITGAAEPHTGGQQALRQELDAEIDRLDLRSRVRFLGDAGPVSDAMVEALYHAADALFFPSEQEGFGLPVLEAALHRLPVFCSETLPLAAVARNYGRVFSGQADPSLIAHELLDFLDTDPATLGRRNVREHHDWAIIYNRHLAPLLRKCETGTLLHP